MGNYDLTTLTELGFESAQEQIRTALKAQGFGVLTEIDVQATLKAKLGVETDPYLILGACNPSFAHQALEADPDIGLLLPCNITVRATSEGTRVSAIAPQALVEMAGPAMEPLAEEVERRLRAALADLPGTEVQPTPPTES